MSTGKAYDGAKVDEATVAEIVRAGGIAVNHYLTGPYATSSCSPATALAAGLGSWATYERAPAELVGLDRAGGRAIGETIAAAMHTAGYPKGCAVFASVDVEVPVTQIGSCDLAFVGIRDAVGAGGWQVRAYGEGALLKHLSVGGLVDGPGWLSGSKSYPGYAEAASGTATYVCLMQGVGSDIPSTDRNTITNVEALGAWWPPDSPHGGDGMELTQQQIDAIAYRVWTLGLGEGAHTSAWTEMSQGFADTQARLEAIEAKLGIEAKP